VEVAAWLRDLGLERYAQAFRDAEVTPEVLPELTDADLRELGSRSGPARSCSRPPARRPVHRRQRRRGEKQEQRSPGCHLDPNGGS
jgi:hypothetical protein